MNKILMASILAIVAVLSFAMVDVAPMAFADKNGAENPKDNHNNGCHPGNPVPCGARPQPNP